MDKMGGGYESDTSYQPSRTREKLEKVGKSKNGGNNQSSDLGGVSTPSA